MTKHLVINWLKIVCVNLFQHITNLFFTSANVVSLQSLGVVDVAATDVQDNSVLAHALLNVSSTDKTQGCAVKHSADFVNEYPQTDDNGNLTDGFGNNPNHLLGSFPCLFPYGKGGFEVCRPSHVSYEAHVHWALRYDDKRFTTDLHFIFQVFSVLQKRKLCAAAALQVTRNTFLRFENEMRHLTPHDFEIAAEEERGKKPFTNVVMQSLRRCLTMVRAKVMGTDESRIKIRSYIWGMCIKKNPPSIWLTLNPANTHDPIAQVFCGNDIDLDGFIARDHQFSDCVEPPDSYSSALFFHFMVQTVLETLLCIKGYKHNSNIQRGEGILGKVEAYIGTVEAQGRGTLHLHMIIWLSGSPTASKMKELLATQEFRSKVQGFIKQNIRADLSNAPGLAVLDLPRKNGVSFSRPVDPRLPDYKKRQQDAEISLARTLQVHQCSQSCMRYAQTRMVCKRRAPFLLADNDWIDEHGNCGPKRTYGFFNNWCPPILQCLRANHDIKLLTNGTDTKDLAWYITLYSTKKQYATTNASALLTKTYIYNRAEALHTHNLKALNKKLIQQCGNTLSREQELSAPEVISYLMGWDDRYISHHFETIQWYSLLQLLKKAYPNLNNQSYVKI